MLSLMPVHGTGDLCMPHVSLVCDLCPAGLMCDMSSELQAEQTYRIK